MVYSHQNNDGNYIIMKTEIWKVAKLLAQFLKLDINKLLV